MHQVRYFLALCDTLNFTRAAEKCNVSQPSLTRAVKGLEDELGGPLFHRERNNTHLTELGRTLKPFLDQVETQLEQAKVRARDLIRLEYAPLRLGIMHTIGPARLLDLFEQFRSGNPGVELHLMDAPAGALQERLDRGDIDIAVLSRPNGIDERYHALKLFDERFLVAVAPAHRLANQPAIRYRDLEGERYLGRIACEFAEQASASFGAEGIVLQRPYRSDRDDWLQSMARAGLGFCFVPEFGETIDGLVTRPLDPEFKRTVSLVTVRGRPHSPVVSAFMRHVVRVKGN